MKSIRFMTSLIRFYLRGTFSFNQSSVTITVPNTIFFFFSVGSKKSFFPIDQLSFVETNFRFRALKFLFGLAIAFFGFISFFEDWLLALIFILIGVNAAIKAFELHMYIHLTSGAVNKRPFLIFDKNKVELIEENINQLIFGRLSDTNNKEQTDRVVEAINRINI